MGYYFEDTLSMFAQSAMDVKHTLGAVARRFIGANPPHPLTYRAYSRRGIRRVSDYRYDADMTGVFPDAKNEQYVYAWAKIWSDAGGPLMYDITCHSPTVIYINGVEAWRSNIFTERYKDAKHRVTLQHQPGWNHYVVRIKKTDGGFGVILGSWLGKHPFTFMFPSPEREGQEGWLFTEPMDKELSPLPGPGTSEASSGIKWLPSDKWDAKQQKLGQLQRIFGTSKGNVAYGWVKGLFLQPGAANYNFTGSSKGEITVFIDDEEVFSSKGGKINASIPVPFGMRDVMVRCTCPGGSDWGFELEISAGKDEPVKQFSPANIKGTDQTWMYVGPFKPSQQIALSDLRNLYNIHRTVNGEDFWRLDMPDTWVRGYNENLLWGRWNYPLGVTLYGMFKASHALESKDIEQYVVNHMQFCSNTFKYALWDRAQYGGATGVHTLLTSIDSLDDCGSFGSAFLEVAKTHNIAGFRDIADYVADYISNKQDRQPDGTFYRLKMMHIFHENTMWADDLYMSTPFLCRYYQLTGDRKYIDDAARQFLGFKKRMFNPKTHLMSHVFDLRRNIPTGIPWGRGNGWPAFSLSEILAVIPEDHELRPQLLQFFREFCEGLLAVQDEQGMWHQVLTHPDAYPETSCTAMFSYAFSRGVQYGWFENPKPYIQAVFKAWEAINRISIDRGANIHGVCRGSEFSFTPEYYKKELLPNLNDTHGVGIVMLMGCEVLKLTKFLQESSGSKSKPAEKPAKKQKVRVK
jgi:rhamnogalacturonyl hydrolase YesR